MARGELTVWITEITGNLLQFSSFVQIKDSNDSDEVMEKAWEIIEKIIEENEELFVSGIALFDFNKVTYEISFKREDQQWETIH